MSAYRHRRDRVYSRPIPSCPIQWRLPARACQNHEALSRAAVISSPDPYPVLCRRCPACLRAKLNFRTFLLQCSSTRNLHKKHLTTKLINSNKLHASLNNLIIFNKSVLVKKFKSPLIIEKLKIRKIKIYYTCPCQDNRNNFHKLNNRE